MKEKFKKIVFAWFKEIKDVTQVFLKGIKNLWLLFWRQSLKKRLVDVFFVIVACTIFKTMSMIIFGLSMSSIEGVQNFDFIQNIMFMILTTFVSMFLFLNFGELFILMSLGGMSLFTTQCKDAINKRMKEMEENDKS